MVNYKNINEFIRIMNKTAPSPIDHDMRFVLLRDSEEDPNWNVYACCFDGKGISAIKGASTIGGHYCIKRHDNIHDVLSALIDSGWKVEVHDYYFYERVGGEL